MAKTRFRITGADRDALRGMLRREYRAGASLRALVDDHQRSYGFVHRILTENNDGFKLRGRGGSRSAK